MLQGLDTGMWTPTLQLGTSIAMRVVCTGLAMRPKSEKCSMSGGGFSRWHCAAVNPPPGEVNVRKWKLNHRSVLWCWSRASQQFNQDGVEVGIKPGRRYERDRNNFHKVAVLVGAWIPEHCPSNSHRLGRWWSIQ